MDEAPLRPAERRFIEAYLSCGDPAAAARNAGYAPSRAENAGRKLLQKPAVREALRRAEAVRPRLRLVTEQTVLGELTAIAFSDFTDFVRVEDGVAAVTDSRDLTYSQRAAIAGIKETGKGVEIKLHDKEKALELLAKYLGLFNREETDAALRVELAGVPEEWAE